MEKEFHKTFQANFEIKNVKSGHMLKKRRQEMTNPKTYNIVNKIEMDT